MIGGIAEIGGMSRRMRLPFPGVLRPKAVGNALRIPGERTLRLVALAAIVALAAALRFANLGALGEANHYYTAAVASMLKSWHNFFFVAAEPGGAVSVDKPPVGLWLQAISAYFLGVNGLGVLLLGAALVGIGFNIKMLQAYLPLPAFYGLYLLGSAERLWRKVAKLALASVLLVVISLSWAVIVDLTPVSQRPYVGSSGDNSEMSLMIGYNGIDRLLGMFGRRGGIPAGGGRGGGMAGFSLALPGSSTSTTCPCSPRRWRPWWGLGLSNCGGTVSGAPGWPSPCCWWPPGAQCGSR